MSENHIKDQIEDLYQKSKNESSPNVTDNLILAQAKQSCKPQQTKQKYKRKNWLFNLSTAAVLVISFSLIFNLQYENEQMITPIPLKKTQKNEINLGDKAKPVSPDSSARRQVNKPSIKNNKKVELPKKLKKQAREPEMETAIVERIAEEKAIDSGNEHNFADEAPDFITIEDTKTKKEGQPLLPKRQIPLETKKQARSEYRKGQYKADQENMELDALIVTDAIELGVSTADTDDIEINLQKQIEKLEGLITEQEYEQAKALLKHLKVSHPDYDFSKFDTIL